jgi:hypothetical protein
MDFISFFVLILVVEIIWRAFIKSFMGRLFLAFFEGFFESLAEACRARRMEGR